MSLAKDQQDPFIPEQLSSESWARLPVGLEGLISNQIVSVDLVQNPNMFIDVSNCDGSILTHRLMVSALTRGHRVEYVGDELDQILINQIEPWLSSLSRTFTETQTAIFRLLAEAQRREALLVRYGKDSWRELPDATRVTSDMRPITLFVESLERFARVADLEPALRGAKGIPEHNLLYWLGRLATKSARTGIHLVLSSHLPYREYAPAFNDSITLRLLQLPWNALVAEQAVRNTCLTRPEDALFYSRSGEFAPAMVLAESSTHTSAFQIGFVSHSKTLDDLSRICGAPEVE